MLKSNFVLQLSLESRNKVDRSGQLSGQRMPKSSTLIKQDMQIGIQYKNQVM